MKQEANVLVILLAGFVAYSLPLLIYDTSNLWSTPVPPNDLPPAPPPYPSYHDDDDNSKFRSAVSDGNIASAEAMYLDGLQQDPPVDFVSTEHWHGNTPLFEAARSGHLEMVKWLIAHGAEADKANEWGDSPTNEAAGMGHWDIVWYLADQGANLKRTVEHAHASLVLSAVRHRSTAALAELQRRGVDLNQKAWNNASPLHEAARMGEADIVDWFLKESSLDVNATNDQGEGAVHEAATMGHKDVMWKLIHAGASLGEHGSTAAVSLCFAAVTHSNTELLELLASRGLLDVEATSHGRNFLIEAVRQGSMPIVEWLIAHGSNVSVTSGDDCPVSLAAFEDRFEIMWRLHAAGASLHVMNEYGGTVLMSAVHYGHEADAVKLIEAGLDVNVANKRGDTPLTLACSREELQLVKTLLARGAKAEPRGLRRDTPLMRAAKFRRLEIARYLLDSRMGDVNAQNARGDTAMIEACRSGATGVVELLIQHGASVTHSNKAGMTAFLEAAESGSYDVLELLLRQPNIDVHAKSKHGDGALELSRFTRRSEEIATLLKQHGVLPLEPEHNHDMPDEHRHHDPDDPDDRGY